MDLEILRQYARWSGKHHLTSFSEVFEAGWKAREASGGVDQSMVLIKPKEFAEIAHRYPDVLGRPIYYAQWPTPPKGQE